MVGILVLAALVTPPDVITQVILFVTVYGLYEVSIWLVARVERKREAELRAQGLWFDDDDEDEAAFDAGDDGEDPLGARDDGKGRD
jgi:sec-independent protein translocase protein TatC